MQRKAVVRNGAELLFPALESVGMLITLTVEDLW